MRPAPVSKSSTEGATTSSPAAVPIVLPTRAPAPVTTLPAVPIAVCVASAAAIKPSASIATPAEVYKPMFKSVVVEVEVNATSTYNLAETIVALAGSTN